MEEDIKVDIKVWDPKRRKWKIKVGLTMEEMEKETERLRKLGIKHKIVLC